MHMCNCVLPRKKYKEQIKQARKILFQTIANGKRGNFTPLKQKMGKWLSPGGANRKAQKMLG